MGIDERAIVFYNGPLEYKSGVCKGVVFEDYKIYHLIIIYSLSVTLITTREEKKKKTIVYIVIDRFCNICSHRFIFTLITQTYT